MSNHRICQKPQNNRQSKGGAETEEEIIKKKKSLFNGNVSLFFSFHLTTDPSTDQPQICDAVIQQQL